MWPLGLLLFSNVLLGKAEESSVALELQAVPEPQLETSETHMVPVKRGQCALASCHTRLTISYQHFTLLVCALVAQQGSMQFYAFYTSI